MSGDWGRVRGGFARRAVLGSWVVLVGLVVMGSLLPAGSPVVAAAGRLPLTDKAMHFLAYLGLSVLPVVGFRERRRGLAAGMAMFGLGCLLEFAQQFSPSCFHHASRIRRRSRHGSRLRPGHEAG